MNPGMALSRVWQAFASAEDGVIMRGAFYGLLATAVVFLAVDIRDVFTQHAAEVPGHDPLLTDQPVLPPALTEGKPHAPPVEPKTEAEVLRQPIRFELQPGGILKAEGAIDPGAADRFRSEIETRGEYVKTVLLNSPGGAVDDALSMSSLIREKGLTTRVEAGGLCASSCPIVMAGGATREAAKDAVIGVHQIFNGSRERPSPEEAMASAQATTARVARHLEEMGIGSGLWLHALETPPDRLYYLTEAELKTFKLVTTAPAAKDPKKKG